MLSLHDALPICRQCEIPQIDEVADPPVALAGQAVELRRDPPYARGADRILYREAGAGRHDQGCLSGDAVAQCDAQRSEEHTSELQSLMRISYAVFCLKKKKNKTDKILKT